MFVYVLFACFSIALTKDLPSYFPRCHVDDPKINECFLEATKTVKPYMIKGIPELHISSISPFFVPQIEIERETDSVKFKGIITNVKMFGLEEYEFSKFDYDPKTFTYHAAVNFNSITIEADYDLVVTILNSTLNGKGKVTVMVGKTDILLDLIGELVNRKGEDYFNVKSTKATITVNDPKLKFDGLGDKELENALNQLLEQNMDGFLKQLIPEVENIVQEMFGQLFSNVFKGVPYVKILPPHNA